MAATQRRSLVPDEIIGGDWVKVLSTEPGGRYEIYEVVAVTRKTVTVRLPDGQDEIIDKSLVLEVRG